MRKAKKSRFTLTLDRIDIMATLVTAAAEEDNVQDTVQVNFWII